MLWHLLVPAVLGTFDGSKSYPSFKVRYRPRHLCWLHKNIPSVQLKLASTVPERCVIYLANHLGASAGRKGERKTGSVDLSPPPPGLLGRVSTNQVNFGSRLSPGIKTARQSSATTSSSATIIALVPILACSLDTLTLRPFIWLSFS